jgi:RecA/RadA recombinase
LYLANQDFKGEKMSKFLNDMIALIDNEYASVVDDGIAAGDVTGYIGTGSYSLNALLSGSIYSGIPEGKITALAGEPSTGKTFYAVNIVKQFLSDYPNGYCIYFETESAISKQMFDDRGIDSKRVAIIPVCTVQEFRTQAVKILDKYISVKGEKPKMMFVLDSLGNLSTQKEMEDIASGSDTRDMTRAQAIRGAFRVLTLKLGKANVSMIVTNHVFQTIGAYIPTKEMGGGQGLTYAASTIIFLTKKKDKQLDDADGRTGAVITAHLKKSRLTIEDKKVATWLNYETGLDPYYGLLDIAELGGIVKKISNKYEFVTSGVKAFESQIKKNPEKFFTKEVLDSIDAFCKLEFCYGSGSGPADDEEIIVEDEETL